MGDGHAVNVVLWTVVDGLSFVFIFYACSVVLYYSHHPDHKDIDFSYRHSHSGSQSTTISLCGETNLTDPVYGIIASFSLDSIFGDYIRVQLYGPNKTLLASGESGQSDTFYIYYTNFQNPIHVAKNDCYTFNITIGESTYFGMNYGFLTVPSISLLDNPRIKNVDYLSPVPKYVFFKSDDIMSSHIDIHFTSYGFNEFPVNQLIGSSYLPTTPTPFKQECRGKSGFIGPYTSCEYKYEVSKSNGFYFGWNATNATCSESAELAPECQMWVDVSTVQTPLLLTELWVAVGLLGGTVFALFVAIVITACCYMDTSCGECCCCCLPSSSHSSITTSSQTNYNTYSPVNNNDPINYNHTSSTTSKKEKGCLYIKVVIQTAIYIGFVRISWLGLVIASFYCMDFVGSTAVILACFAYTNEMWLFFASQMETGKVFFVLLTYGARVGFGLAYPCVVLFNSSFVDFGYEYTFMLLLAPPMLHKITMFDENTAKTIQLGVAKSFRYCESEGLYDNFYTSWSGSSTTNYGSYSVTTVVTGW
eukprot:CAMPEP_0174263242 /NCGR_PEP_ID=MMETSP0439-20130205/17831_1 /TAXON_ID=0 /ORGANISM="Stereomyxa ramosa, Strain Chinc5" /LENGTH=532 /DNA_ID=CAMNT_0015348491 /DNA_START=32 /DNA_END=1627 /DNA_ORIENTATION=-